MRPAVAAKSAFGPIGGIEYRDIVLAVQFDVRAAVYFHERAATPAATHLAMARTHVAIGVLRRDAHLAAKAVASSLDRIR